MSDNPDGLPTWWWRCRTTAYKLRYAASGLAIAILFYQSRLAGIGVLAWILIMREIGQTGHSLDDIRDRLRRVEGEIDRDIRLSDYWLGDIKDKLRQIEDKIDKMQ